MDREKLIVIIITVAVIAGAFGLVLGGVFTRPARKAVDAEIADIRADAAGRIAELKAEVAAAERGRKAAVADARRAREQTRSVASKAIKDVKAARKSRTTIVKPRPKARQVRPSVVDVSATTAEVRKMIDDGVVYSVDVDSNEVRVDPAVWSLLEIGTKRNMVAFFSSYFDQAGSTGRVDVLSSRNDTKLATYGAWGGVKILR